MSRSVSHALQKKKKKKKKLTGSYEFRLKIAFEGSYIFILINLLIFLGQICYDEPSNI